MIIGRFAGQTNGSLKSAARTDAHENAVGFKNQTRHCRRLFIADLHDFMVDRRIECSRNKPCADTLDFVRTGFTAGQDG